MRICNLNPETAKTVQRILLELLAYKRRFPTRRSSPIKLGSKSEVLINPTVRDTETETDDKKDVVLGKTKKVSKSEERHTEGR